LLETQSAPSTAFRFLFVSLHQLEIAVRIVVSLYEIHTFFLAQSLVVGIEELNLCFLTPFILLRIRDARIEVKYGHLPIRKYTLDTGSTAWSAA
jgi:hypothetical protein